MTRLDALMDLIRGRRSIRRFRDDPVPRELVDRLLVAASWAPSAGNRQDWRFSVVVSPELRREMADSVRKRWQAIVDENRDLGLIEEVSRYVSSFAAFEHAPLVIAVSAAAVGDAERHLLGGKATATVGGFASAAMAAQNLMLAAHALGLGTCCMTGCLAAADDLSRLLDLGRRRELVCLIAIGYPAEEPEAPPRKPVDGIARYHG